MRILITGIRLDSKDVRHQSLMDLARNLQIEGHSVAVYSSSLTPLRCLPGNETVPVVSDIEKLPFVPDVIHGQHHFDLMTAVLGLPGVPALYHCDDDVWQDWSLQHPRIYQDRATSRTLAEKMAAEIYERVIESHRQAAPDARAEMLAASRYLRKVSSLIATADHSLGWFWISPSRPSTLEELGARVARIEQRVNSA